MAADDGCQYVLKLANNPQPHPCRVLINEWIGCRILQELGVAVPEVALIYVDNGLSSAIPLASPGWHFGSRYPAEVASYDMLPDRVLTGVANLTDFVGVLVADKWMGNTDMRQCIFVRDRLKKYINCGKHSPLEKGFVALMIDQHHLFDGYRWAYVDAPKFGLYSQTIVYKDLEMAHFDSWIERVSKFQECALAAIIREMPSSWLQRSDNGPLQELLDKLMTHRRRRLPDLILEAHRRLLHG